MWHYPEIDPIAISLGPVSIHWYAISYLVGIGLVWVVLRNRSQKKGLQWSDDDLSDILFYTVLGVLLGGRVGYMVFYGLDNLIENPLSVFKIWQGGMSFHGGLIGFVIGVVLFARKRRVRFFEVMDFVAPAIPLALGCGRIGNFINAELPGRMTEVQWAVIYPGEAFGRHPSSLYQATLEGPVLFAFLWLYSMKPKPLMVVSGMFLIGYGSLRIFSEFFREPDAHMGFVLLDWVTTGQLLSLPMIILGLFLLFYSYLQNRNRK